MSILVDQVIELPAPPRSRKTTYEAGIHEGATGHEIIAYAQYFAPNETFCIERRGRTERAALKALRHAAWKRWSILSPTSRAGRREWKLVEAVDKEISRK